MRSKSSAARLEIRSYDDLCLMQHLLKSTSWTPHELYFLRNSFAALSVDPSASTLVLDPAKLAFSLHLATADAAKVSERLVDMMTDNSSRKVTFDDWVSVADRVTRSPIYEHMRLMWRYLGLHRGTTPSMDSLASYLAFVPAWNDSCTANLEELLRHSSSAELMLEGCGHSRLAVHFSRFLMGIFAPVVRDMQQKLKKTSRRTLHVHAWLNSADNLSSSQQAVSSLGDTDGEVPITVDVLCSALRQAIASDPSAWDFELESIRDQRPMVEAVLQGVEINPDPAAWSTVGVPVLLMALRVHLRSYHEALMTQHLSKVLVSVARVNRNASCRRHVPLFREKISFLPPAHHATLTLILDTLSSMSMDELWINTCGLVFGSTIFNDHTNETEPSRVVEFMTECLMRDWNSIRA